MFSEPFQKSAYVTFLTINSDNNIQQLSMSQPQLKTLTAAYGEELILNTVAQLSKMLLEMIAKNGGMPFKANIRNNTVTEISVKRKSTF